MWFGRAFLAPSQGAVLGWGDPGVVVAIAPRPRVTFCHPAGMGKTAGLIRRSGGSGSWRVLIRRSAVVGLDGGEDVGDFGEAADALVAAGEVAGGGGDEGAAVLLEGGDVALCGGVVPHFAVHGGGDEGFGGGGEGEVDGGEGVRGEAVGEEGDGVGGGGCDEEEVGGVGEFDVAGFP